MAFDINKYDKEVFHNDAEINDKIKVLTLWFDYQVHRNSLPINEQIKLIDDLLNVAIKEEWYEMAEHFSCKKENLKNNE